MNNLGRLDVLTSFHSALLKYIFDSKILQSTLIVVVKPPSRFCFIFVPEFGLGEFWGSEDCCWKYPRLIVAKDFGAVCSQSPETYQYTDGFKFGCAPDCANRLLRIWGEFFYDLGIGAGNVHVAKYCIGLKSPRKNLIYGCLGSASDCATPVLTSFG